MSGLRLVTIVVAFVGAGVVALGWFLGIAPLLASSATAEAERAAVETTNDGHRAEVERLREQAGRLEELRSELEARRVQAPELSEGAEFHDTLAALASAHEVVLEVFTAEESFSPLELSAQTETEAAELDPRLTPANLFATKISATVGGSEPNVLAFVEAAQDNPRFFLVTNLSFGADSSATLTGYVLTVRDDTTAPVPGDGEESPPSDPADPDAPVS